MDRLLPRFEPEGVQDILEAEGRGRPSRTSTGRWRRSALRPRREQFNRRKRGRPRISTTDRQRIAAVKTLEEMGNTFGGDKWFGPDATAESPEADAMHALLVLRADQWRAAPKGRGAGVFGHRQRNRCLRTKAMAGKQDTGRQGLAVPRSNLLDPGKLRPAFS